MTLRIPAKVLLHVWSYDFYDMTLSTGKQRRHMIISFFFFFFFFFFFLIQFYVPFKIISAHMRKHMRSLINYLY